MILRKSIVRFWLIFAVVLAVAMAAITVAFRWHQLFPTDEVSEYYTRYAERKGITASYVKDYRINDTLRLDVTVLEVSDSVVWEQVCEELHLLTTAQLPEEYRDLYFSPNGFESYVLYDTVTVNGEPCPLQTVFIYTRYNRTVCIFHSVTEVQYDAIMDKEIDEI